MGIFIKALQKINYSMEKGGSLKLVEIFIKENLKKEKLMEMEFSFKYNKAQFMMVIGLMMKNTEKELKNGNSVRFPMLVISKTDKKLVRESWLSTEANMKEISWMENFKDRASISILKSKELWKELSKKADSLVEKLYSKMALFMKENT
jgi:hypothetical protein